MQDMPIREEEKNGTYGVYGFQPKCSNLIQSDIIEGKTFEEYCIIDVPDVGETFLICDENKDRKVRILAISMIASVIFLVLTAVIIWTRNKEKLFGAMTLNMMLMLMTYFLLTLLAQLVPSSDFQCHVSKRSISSQPSEKHI